MLSLQAPRERGRLLKLQAFTISFETLAAGGWSLLRSELLVKASGLSKPQKFLWEGYGHWEDFPGGYKIFGLVWIPPRVVRIQAGPSEARALC